MGISPPEGAMPQPVTNQWLKGQQRILSGVTVKIDPLTVAKFSFAYHRKAGLFTYNGLVC